MLSVPNAVEEKEKSVEGKEKKIVDRRRRSPIRMLRVLLPPPQRREVPQMTLSIFAVHKRRRNERRRRLKEYCRSMPKESPLRSKNEDVVEIDSDATLSEDEGIRRKKLRQRRVIKDARRLVARQRRRNG